MPDLVVVGGGPAGLATAIAARLAGLSVRVLERARPPIDKACGEGLMPDAVRLLEKLGVELPAESCHRFRGIRYVDGELTAVGLFPQAGGLGVRRPVLHQALARRAAELGAELCWGAAVAGLAVQGVMMASGEVIEARWVAGADGLRSRVRRWAGLEGAPARHRRFGVRRHYACQPWNDLVEVHWGPRCEAYVTPVGPEEVGVALLWEDDAASVAARGWARAGGAADAGAGRVSFDALLAHFPALAERLAGAPVTSRDRGAGPLAQRARRVWRANAALVGDAAGYLDAITGEGLAVALHQAVALAAALANFGVLASYGAACRRIGRLPDIMTALVLALERRPWLRRRVFSALAAEPALFSRLLGIHARTLPPAGLGIDGALRLVYRLVTA